MEILLLCQAQNNGKKEMPALLKNSFFNWGELTPILSDTYEFYFCVSHRWEEGAKNEEESCGSVWPEWRNELKDTCSRGAH